MEIWIERTSGQAATPQVTESNAVAALNPFDRVTVEPEVFILKFNGTGGRAERAAVHPLDAWTDLPGEVWSANPPGYGGSEGSASLRYLAATGCAVLEELLKTAGHRPIVITGNSLGTTSALHVAATYADVPNLVGLVLRNPPPLRQIITERFGWRTAGLSLLVARQVPAELDSVANAARARLPAVFHCAGRDRIVPPRFQRMVIDAYGGPKQVVTAQNADHVFTPTPPEQVEYGQALVWLRQAMGR